MELELSIRGKLVPKGVIQINKNFLSSLCCVSKNFLSQADVSKKYKEISRCIVCHDKKNVLYCFFYSRLMVIGMQQLVPVASLEFDPPSD